MESLNYLFSLSFKEICLRRLAVIFWSQTDVLESFLCVNCEDKVEDNISKLKLPPSMIEQIKKFVKPVKSEMLNWKLFHQKYLKIPDRSFNMKILKQLIWTVLGTVDYKKTAEHLINLKFFDNVQRYRLACLYCLVDRIPLLLEELPPSKRGDFYEKVTYFTLKPSLDYYWPFILKGEESNLYSMLRKPNYILDDELVRNDDYSTGYTNFIQFTIELPDLSDSPDTFNEFAFQDLALKGNKEATEYFFHKLTFDEKKSILLKTALDVLRRQGKHKFERDNFSHERHSDTFRYLLSVMSPEQRMKIIKQEPHRTLLYVLDWPWQHTFWDIAKLIWPLPSSVVFVTLLQIIARKIVRGYCLIELFEEFFSRGSTAYKDSFIVNSLWGDIFNARNGVKGFEINMAILKNLDYEAKLGLLTTWRLFDYFYDSISDGNMHAVEQCFQECCLSKKDKRKLRNYYLKRLSDFKERSANDIWKQLAPFLE